MNDERVKGLKCRECGSAVPSGPVYVCEECFGPLEVSYDYDAISRVCSRESIAAGPRSIWRYGALLPAPPSSVVSLSEGFTPLHRAERLGAALGLRRLYVKNDAVNPTYSFKDRVVSVAVSCAKAFGFDTLSCASTGNLAGAVAAFGAVAGLRPVIFIPADLEPSKVTGIGAYGATVIRVEGSYDDVNRLCAEISAREHWAFVNVNLRPYYAEGSKTLGFEVAEQLGWRAPDHVVAPIASGSLLCKIGKGLAELATIGLIDEHPTRFSGAQGEGCAPVATAFAEGSAEIRPVKPRTLAKSLAIGNPADGLYALEAIRRSGGGCAAVPDEEIVAGMQLLARTEGIFAETAGGVTIAALARLARERRIDPDELVVAYVTGNGYKTQESLVPSLPSPILIRASLGEFEAIRGRIPAAA